MDRRGAVNVVALSYS